MYLGTQDEFQWLTTLLVVLRELAIIGAIVGAAWKARGLWDRAVSFFDRIEKHMDTMEEFAQVVVENHLKHIEQDFNQLVKALKSFDPEGIDES